MNCSDGDFSSCKGGDATQPKLLSSINPAAPYVIKHVIKSPRARTNEWIRGYRGSKQLQCVVGKTARKINVYIDVTVGCMSE